MEEFTQNYGVAEDGKYVITRDVGSYAIQKEVEAGRGSPHGGVYLSFQHVPEADLRAAFGPVIDRLAANGIDLTKMPIEVAPIAHYHMGGIAADAHMQTDLPGLFAAGEAVGGANGANRLSGNAITEAFVFGARAGLSAAQRAVKAPSPWSPAAARPALDLLRSAGKRDAPNPAAVVTQLQAVMADDVGPFRTDAKLRSAIAAIAQLKSDIGDTPLSSAAAFDPVLVDWLDLRNALLVAQAVVVPALARTESRGAHQRDDHPGLEEGWCVNQVVSLSGATIHIETSAPSAGKAAA